MPDSAFPVQGYQGNINQHWGSVNGGSDIFANRGTPVVAMRGGRVIEAGWNSIGGNSVLIQGDDGNQYYYAHFDAAPSVKVGDNITAGTYLGPVGDTGDAQGTGTHLHLGIGPNIRLGSDKYGGTGGDFDAVSLIRSALAGTNSAAFNTNPLQSQTPTTSKDYGNVWANRAAAIAESMHIPPELFVRLVKQESGFNPTALNPRSGASGLSQLMPDTARGLGVNNIMDPEENLQGGARYFRQMLDRYGGDPRLALAAYNAGPGNVDQYRGVPPFQETLTYINTILGGDNFGPVPGAQPTVTMGDQAYKPAPNMQGGLFNGLGGGFNPQSVDRQPPLADQNPFINLFRTNI